MIYSVPPSPNPDTVQKPAITLVSVGVRMLPIMCALVGLFLIIPAYSISSSILIALPIAFALIWIANLNHLNQSQCAMFGATIGLKFSIIKTIGPWLIGTPELFSTGASQLVWPSLLLLLCLIWIYLGCRSLSIVRILGLCGLSLATSLMAIYVGQDPWDYTGNVRRFGAWDLYDRFEVLRNFHEYELPETIQTLLLGTLFGFVGGFSVKNKEFQSGFRPFFQFRLSNLIENKPVSLPAVGLGLLFCCSLIGVLSANNSHVTIGREFVSFFPNVGEREPDGYGIAQYQSVILFTLAQFDALALRSALDGVLRALPVMSAGGLLIWWLGRFRLTGLGPVLAIGASGGLAWHMLYPSYGYWTPFLSVAQSAMLIGMIMAAGFGAVAQIVDYQRYKATKDDKLIAA
jgi:hypothetical protein